MANRVSRRSGEHVPVIGAADSESGGGDVPAASRSPRVGSGVALVVAAALAIVTIVTLVGEDEDSTPTDVSLALPPPVEPSVATTAPEPKPPEFALGWKQLKVSGYSGQPAVGQVIDAGPSGWVAVTQGNFAQMVHTSRDGVGWRTTTLEEVGWIATVFSGSEGLFVAVSGGSGRAGIWRSVDGGFGWERSTLPDEEALVVSVSEAAGRVWAAGMVGSSDPWSTGKPAVWVLEGEDWIPVALEGERGWVASVVEWDGGVWGFGSDMGAVVWDLVAGERFEVGADIGMGGFRMVVAHEGALWGLFALGLMEPGGLFTSPDPFGWGPAPGPGHPSGVIVEPIGGHLVLLGESHVDLFPGTSIPPRIAGYTTGRENSSSVTGLAVEDGQAAFLGQDFVTGETLLWTRGTVSEPIALLDPERMAWSARRELSAFVWGGGPVVVWDDRIFLQGPGGVYEWVFGTDLVEVPGAEVVTQLQSTEAGLLAVGHVGVWVLRGNEFVDVGPMPDRETSSEADSLCTASLVDGRLMVADCSGRVWERDADGEWSQLDQGRYPIAQFLDGVFLSYDPISGESGITVDGSTLEFRGQVEWGLSGQNPFVVLERRSDSATVRLIEPWPDGVTFQVPTSAPLEVSWVGDTLRVQSPSTLYISSDRGRSWTEVPIGVENGFPEGGLLLPTEALMVIAPKAGQGSVSVLYTPRS